ncbi:hypothetical protein ACH4OY_07020 [Micromonospora rubida]|uniref:Uncharacterized protein n=1 Tax=Micromonospora rubida TaxID=2697657 RepID=A0ABW7SFH8_9ACTN
MPPIATLAQRGAATRPTCDYSSSTSRARYVVSPTAGEGVDGPGVVVDHPAARLVGAGVVHPARSRRSCRSA